MNVQLEPTLEQFVKDEDFKEIKESNLPSIKSPQETIISKPVEIKAQTILKKTLKVNKNSKEYHFVEKMQEKGKLKKRKTVRVKDSCFFSPSLKFLSPFNYIEGLNFESIDKKDDLSLGQNIMMKKENEDIENMNNLNEDNIEEKDPIKRSLINRLKELEQTKARIKIQFENDKKIYLKKIQKLENICNSNPDENRLKRLIEQKKKNDNIIKDLKLDIQREEKQKIKDKQKFNESLNYILDLKYQLINEINELEIMAKNSSFVDYDEYKLENPTKIEKNNFRPNDSRYLLTNEYETSRDDDESISSYEKLNNINNTPDILNINRQDLYFNKTMNYNHQNMHTKNSNKYPLSTNNDIISEKINNKHNNTFNKGTEGSLTLKPKENKENNKKSKPQQLRINSLQPQQKQTNNKRIYPKDPDFLNKDMILIRNNDDNDSETFY